MKSRGKSMKKMGKNWNEGKEIKGKINEKMGVVNDWKITLIETRTSLLYTCRGNRKVRENKK